MVRAARRTTFLATVACLASGCGGDGGPTGPVPVATVVVTPSPATVRVGETLLLTATPQDQAGTPLTGRTVTWTSVNVTVASVASGVVRGVGEGTTDVSAVVEGTLGTVAVTVTPPRIVSVDVRPLDAQVLVGGTLQLTATPRSATGAPLPGRTVTWSTSDSTVARVSASGLASGVGGGEVTITATAEQQIGTTDLDVIDPDAPRITAITPYPLVEGAPATLNGVNFGATLGANAVTVDGVAAVVTAADTTTVTFTVPATGCRPLRDVSVRVSAGGRSGTRTHPLQPAAFTDVGIGEQVILGGTAARCLQFDPTSSFESYLVGVQSTSADASDVSSVLVTARTGLAAAGAAGALAAGAAPSSALQAPAPQAPVAADLEAPGVLGTYAERHLEARSAESLLLRSGAFDFASAAAGALQGAIPPNATVGQRFTVRVPPHYPGSCTQFVTITTELRVITDRGYWLVDVDNLAGGYTDAHLQQIADEFEDDVAPPLEAMFGAIPDTDGSARIGFVATSQVNLQGWLSYPSLFDYLPASQCAASNEGDWLYLATPGTGASFTSSFLLAVMGYSFSHDFTHVIQNRAVIGGGTRAAAWIDEGQAALGEEIYAHRVSNPVRSARQNYGSSVIFTQIGQIQPYSMVAGLAFYFGFAGSALPKVAGAPELCTWLDPVDGGTPSGPCEPPGASSGAWAFLRWLTDHYGAALGGDGVLHQGLIDATGPGFDRVEALVGIPIETLLARFAASLYVDDRISLADATLAFPSWNLFEYDQGVVQPARLTPRALGFTSFTDTAAARGASTVYYQLSASGRPATAVEVTAPLGGPLDPDVQVWVVRLQ